MPHFNASGVSDNLIELCNHEETIASGLRKKPRSSVHAIWEALYPKPFVLKRLVNRFTIKHDLYHGRGDPTKEDLDRAERCGKFPYRPSDLFLKIFSDVLLCLERDPLSGMCPPPLMGTSGVIPLSIVSVIPDIMQHYYDCIIRAEKEVVLATNYWQPSNSVNKISSALIDLSQLLETREQKEKIVVKIMWDRGQFSQLIDNHAFVTQEGMEALDLPRPDEIPNIELEVINFHRPLLGTYHVKFLVVDRKIALLNSNNIQDRPNLEMMIHLEGAVVESFYDIFLYSWHHRMTPLLPCVIDPPEERYDHTAKATDFKFQDQNPYMNDIELVKAAKAARQMLHLEKTDDDRLARLRSDAEKERPFGGYGGRFQAALGAIAESRRGSFSADARDQDLLKDPDGVHKQGGPAKFTEAVMKAMDGRRKGFGASKANEATTTHPQSGPFEEASDQRSKLPDLDTSPATHAAQRPNHTSTRQEPSLVNWAQPGDALNNLHKEIQELESPARAKQNADNAQAFVAESHYRTSLSSASSTHGAQENQQFLPALDLPGSSLQTPAGSAAHSMHSQPSMQGQSAAPEHASHGLQPPTQGDHSLSPVPSERSAAAHPGTSSVSLEDANEPSRSKGKQSNGDPPLAIPMHVRDYAASESASPGTTPALAHSQYSTLTDPSSKGPDTPPAASNGPVRGTQMPTASASSHADGVSGVASQPSTSKEHGMAQGSHNKSLFSHLPDPNGKTLTTFKFSSFAERRNMNISTGSSSAGSKPPPKKNWIEGLVLGKGAKAGPAMPPPEVQSPRQRALSNALNAGALSAAWSTVDDSDLLDEFNPHTLHAAHDPFPIAMVNRKPHGLPGHQDIRVPQDAAWLAGVRYAQKSVFIQTPTFNAKPIVAACIDACRRGIQVTIWVDLGFNDKGESMPFQGGTNEQVVERMYKDLRRTNHQKNLHVYWYCGKDQVRPLNAVKKQRNCHVKFMQVDDQVAIQGNGNQDTQSWYHSAEVNVLIDSAQIVGDWMQTLHRQQNTHLYGRVDDDGIWRDKATGKTPAEMDAWEAEQLAAGIEKPQGSAYLDQQPRAESGMGGGSTPKSARSRLSLGKKGSRTGTPQKSTSSMMNGSAEKENVGISAKPSATLQTSTQTVKA